MPISAALVLETTTRNLQLIERYVDQVKVMTRQARWSDEDYQNIVKGVNRKLKEYDREFIRLRFQITLIEFFLKNPLRRYPVNRKFRTVFDAIRRFLDNWLYVSDEEMQHVGAMMRDLDKIIED